MNPLRLDYSKRVEHFAHCVNTLDTLISIHSQNFTYIGADLIYLRDVSKVISGFCQSIEGEEATAAAALDINLILYGEEDAELLDDFEFIDSWTSVSMHSPGKQPSNQQVDGVIYWVKELKHEGLSNCLQISRHLESEGDTLFFIIFERDSPQYERLRWQAAQEGIILLHADTHNLVTHITIALRTQRSIFSRLIHSFLIGHSHPDVKQKHHLLRELDRAIESCLAKGENSVQCICRLLPYSASQLNRRIRRITGLTLSHYINRYKLAKGGVLLCTTDWSIGRIAFELGYSSQQYFCKLFRKNYDMSPRAYRAQMQK